MKTLITIIIILFYVGAYSQIFPEPTGMSGTLKKKKKVIDKCEAYASAGWHQIKWPSVARRYKFNIALWNEMYQIKGKEDKIFGCWPTLTCQSCKACSISWNKIGRITFVHNASSNNFKLHLGWKADPEQDHVLKFAAYFHEAFKINWIGSMKDYHVRHYVNSAHTDTELYIDMFMSLGTIALIVGDKAVVCRRPGMIPGPKESNLKRTFYFGDDWLPDAENCVTPTSMAVEFRDQEYDKSGFVEKLNNCKKITVNLSEFESGDEQVFYAYEEMLGSILDPSDVNFEEGHPEPIKQKCIISSGADITFSAGEKVILYPGFHAKPGSHFQAKIVKKKKYPGYYDEPKKLNLPPLDQSGTCSKLYDSVYFAGEINKLEENVKEGYFYNKEGFVIYPNPSSGLFTLRFDDGETDSYSVEVRNVVGKVVFVNKDIHTEVSAIDISKEPAGIYFVKISAGGKIYTEKVVVQ